MQRQYVGGYLHLVKAYYLFCHDLLHPALNIHGLQENILLCSRVPCVRFLYSFSLAQKPFQVDNAKTSALLLSHSSLCRPHLVKGYMQLYSVEQKRSQALEAHAAAFSTIKASHPCMLVRSPAHSCSPLGAIQRDGSHIHAWRCL